LDKLVCVCAGCIKTGQFLDHGHFSVTMDNLPPHIPSPGYPIPPDRVVWDSPVHGPDFPPDTDRLPTHTLQAIIHETIKALNSSGLIIQQLIKDRIIPRDRAADALDAISRGMWVPVNILMGGDHIPYSMDFDYAPEKRYELSIPTTIRKLQTRDMVEVQADKVEIQPHSPAAGIGHRCWYCTCSWCVHHFVHV
jgi:hypothetical protein